MHGTAPRLDPRLLLRAYVEGLFPMADESGEVYWYDPDPRAIIPLDTFHVPRRLRRTVRRATFEVRLDTSFRAVMEACAAPGPGREQTWISDDLVEAYVALHRMGFAHSVETWSAGTLVGGVYGVSLGGLFAGESMFSRATDASKVALVHLVERLRAGGFSLFDVQFVNPHLEQFGVVEISRDEYRERLRDALRLSARFEPPGAPAEA